MKFLKQKNKLLLYVMYLVVSVIYKKEQLNSRFENQLMCLDKVKW